ncbi:hypothetical protein AAFN60_12745 [Roseibacillus persicicus]|uniref:hypothetical protein n=1 Tax=Roseibacillus persicicus TaxID=454148 RepID=UPI00398A5709
MMKMKLKSPWLLSLALVILFSVFFVWSSTRMQSLESQVATLKTNLSQMREGQGELQNEAPDSQDPAPDENSVALESPAVPEPDEVPEEDVKKPETPERALGELFRAFAESDTAKQLQKWGNQSRAARVYDALIDEFNLEGDEKEYFLQLTSSSVGAQEKLWSDLLATQDPAERQEIIAQYEADSEKLKLDMQDFLNNEEDFQRFSDFEERRPIYEQMGGIRSSMQRSNLPLSSVQETQLVEAMQQARTSSGIADRWEGNAVVNQIDNPGMAERFRADWDNMQQELLAPASGILEPAQLEVFQRQQAQTRQGVMTALLFAESTMKATE